MAKSLKELQLQDKKVLIRVDFNVPLKDGKITNDNRIVAALDTINYVIDNGGKVILFSHLGRVKTEEDKLDKTLKPVAERLSELLNKDVIFVDATRGEALEAKINDLKSGEVLLVQNTRFEKGETKNDEELGKYWASLGDVYINDAFGTAHRAHASNVGIAEHLESAPGFLLQKEIDFIGGSVSNPQRPLVAILGGAKVSDKIGVIENLISTADKILIGGGMMFTFLKAQGKNIGKSLVEEDKIELAKELLAKADGKIVLPSDTVVAKEFKNDTEFRTVTVDNIEDDEMGLDIGAESVAKFKDILSDAKTVVWNGPMGVFEMENFAKGTVGICEALAEIDAITIIGGGDSAAAAMQLGFEDKFSHISTGGGASLEYLEGKLLPGIECLK